MMPSKPRVKSPFIPTVVRASHAAKRERIPATLVSFIGEQGIEKLKRADRRRCESGSTPSRMIRHDPGEGAGEHMSAWYGDD